MRSLVLALLLAFAAVPAHAQQFSTIGTSEEGVIIQVGPRTSSPNGEDLVAMDSVEIFPSQRTLPDGRAYVAILYHHDWDCAARRYRVPSLIYFADPGLSHEVLWDPVHTGWQPVIAGTIADGLLGVACGG